MAIQATPTLTATPAMKAAQGPKKEEKRSSVSDGKVAGVFDQRAVRTPSAAVLASAIVPSFALPAKAKDSPEALYSHSKALTKLFLSNLERCRSRSDFFFYMYDHNLRKSQQVFPDLRKIHVERTQGHILQGAERVKNPKAVWILAPSTDLELPLVEKLSKFEKIYLIGMNEVVKSNIPEHLKDKVQWVECDLTGNGKEEISKLFARAKVEQWDKDRAFEECIKFMSDFQCSSPSFPSELPSYLVCSLVMTDIGRGLKKLTDPLELDDYYEGEIDEAYLEPEEIAAQRQRKEVFEALGAKFETAFEQMNKRIQLQFLRLIGKGIPDQAPNLELIFFADAQASARYTFTESGELDRSEEERLSHFSHSKMFGALCDIETTTSWEYLVSPPNSSHGKTGMVLDLNALFLRPKKT